MENGTPMEYDEVKDLLNDPNDLEKIQKISEDIIRTYYLGNHLLSEHVGDYQEDTENYCEMVLKSFAVKYYKFFKQDVVFYISSSFAINRSS
jgi:RNase adaptor protein for sRNA GlmZ degradation